MAVSRGVTGDRIDLARGEIPWAVVAQDVSALDLVAVLQRGFNYSAPDGLDDLRRVFVDRFATRAEQVEDAVVTGGALGALDLAFRAIRRDRPGARLVVVEPTYREALGIARAAGLPIVGWSDLGRALRRDDVVYVVPSFNNPDGRSISAVEREKLASAVVDAGAALIEDAAYDLLAAVSTGPTPSVCSAVGLRSDATWALRLMSFSKTVVPGARICLVEGSVGAMAAVRSLKVDFGTSPFACALIAELVRDPQVLDQHVAVIADRLDRGRDAARQAFASWDRPPTVGGAGYFLWLSTGGASSAEATARADSSGVLVSDGAPFFVGGSSTHVRLSMAWEPAEKIHEACLRLEESLVGRKEAS